MVPKRNIEVLTYNPLWVNRYEDEASRLHAIFGGAILAIHHIGSTAVPGTRAKPTFDILAVVGEEIDIPSFDHHMEEEGYISPVATPTTPRHVFQRQVRRKSLV